MPERTPAQRKNIRQIIAWIIEQELKWDPANPTWNVAVHDLDHNYNRTLRQIGRWDKDGNRLY